jgi:hypothetical protein
MIIISEKPRIRKILQYIWPVLLKIIKVMKNKESVRNPNRPEETGRHDN